MDLLIYVIFLLGSYSPGYGLIRAGFPFVQKRKFLEKVALGYIAGLILFGVPFIIIDSLNLLDTYYIILCLIFYFLLLLILFLKRTILNETDELTKDEQLEMRKLNEFNSKNNYKSNINYADLVKNEKKEETPNLESKINSNYIKFDQGLMVKSRKVEEQVFKEENKNILSQVNNETKEITQNESIAQKNSVLTKLREYAQDINSTKKEGKPNKKEELEDLESEEELLNMIKED